ncbi:hypothetical protein GWL_27280 [Herbaspirillum sp. GW103]|nr:hypothetical protein GWL_27280 [Herbaspirillum sp. GW103]
MRRGWVRPAELRGVAGGLQRLATALQHVCKYTAQARHQPGAMLHGGQGAAKTTMPAQGRHRGKEKRERGAGAEVY